jgi:hypothetical protein
MGDIARNGYGVGTRQELLGAGISERVIESRLRTGALLAEFPGVYRVGHRAPSTRATYLAAVKACGEGALLCGPAAAHLWSILKGSAPRPEVLSLAERRVSGIVTHRARRQPGEDVAIRLGIPVTTVARTLVDVAAVLSIEALSRACHEAGVLYGTTPREIGGVLRRRPASKGARKLRRITEGDYRVALSKLERRFLQCLRESRLPLPSTNKVAGTKRVDCRWPHHRLTVELDSYRYHNSRHSWERDRQREREARARGDDFRRYTWDDVFIHSQPMLRELTALLTTSRPG